MYGLPSQPPSNLPTANELDSYLNNEDFRPAKRVAIDRSTNSTNPDLGPHIHSSINSVGTQGHGGFLHTEDGTQTPWLDAFINYIPSNPNDFAQNQSQKIGSTSSVYSSNSLINNQPTRQFSSDYVGVRPSTASNNGQAGIPDPNLGTKRKHDGSAEPLVHPAYVLHYGAAQQQPSVSLHETTDISQGRQQQPIIMNQQQSNIMAQNLPTFPWYGPIPQMMQIPSISTATTVPLQPQPLQNRASVGQLCILDRHGQKTPGWDEFLRTQSRQGNVTEEALREYLRIVEQQRGQDTNVQGVDHRRPSDDTSATLNNSGLRVPDVILNKHQIARKLRGYQKEFRLDPKAPERKFKCTLGCCWSHGKKANLQRHELTHYPQEVWVCSHQDCRSSHWSKRYSLRKDTAQRHYRDHHLKSKEKQNGLTKEQLKAHNKAENERLAEFKLTDSELEEQHVVVEDSLFPRVCVFRDCTKIFKDWDERRQHIDGHLLRENDLLKDTIAKFSLDESTSATGLDTTTSWLSNDRSLEINNRQPITLKPRKKRKGKMKRKNKTANDEDDDDDDEDNDGDDNNDDGDGNDGGNDNGDDDDTDDNDSGNDDDNNSGANNSNTGGGTNGPESHNSDDQPPASGQSGSKASLNSQPAYLGGWTDTSSNAWFHLNSSFCSYQRISASSFDTFGGSGFIPSIDPRPWKGLKSLRLQLLPQVFARGLAQTPLVLKKIQLHAALVFEASGKRKDQMVKILRREIAIMAKALPITSRPTIKGFPTSAPMTKLIPTLRKSLPKYESTLVSAQEQAILRLSGMEQEVLQESSSSYDEDADDPDDNLGDSINTFHGGQVYRCLQVRSTGPPIRPSRLVHVGSKTRPMLHLDTSEKLPDRPAYCSLSHCWDDGDILSLSKTNMADLSHEIPAHSLTRTIHLAINIARDKGVEYVWIDALCIILDSQEDLISETPRITQIHASATFSIVITSVAFDGKTTCASIAFEPRPVELAVWKDLATRDLQQSLSEDMAQDTASVTTTPALTIGPSIADTISTKQRSSDSVTVPDGLETSKRVPRIPIRRGSHQLESFLAETSKKSSFLPLRPLQRPAKPAPISQEVFSRDMQLSLSEKLSKLDSLDSPPLSYLDESDASSTLASLSRGSDSSSIISAYMDKWQSYWQKVSSRSRPTSRANSREPSISEMSDQGEKKRGKSVIFEVAWNKLSGGLKRRDTQQFEMDVGSRELEDLKLDITRA